jgi:hypothetical protein
MSSAKWNWTPRAKAIGEVIQVITAIGVIWFLASAYWFMLGGQ